MKKASPPQKPKVFYGYWIVLASFLCLFFMSGCGFFAFSLFVIPIQSDLCWSRGGIMAGFTVFSLTLGVASPFIGVVVDRYGARQVISLGALVAGLGFVILSQVNNIWDFYLGYAVTGVGMAAMGYVPTSAVVLNWFEKNRGLVIGMMSTGVGGGGFAMAPLVGGYLIPTFGWRASYLALAVILWVLIIPLALLVIRARSDGADIFPDGIRASEADKIIQTWRYGYNALTLKMALCTVSFWLIFISFLSSAFSQVGAIQSQVPYLEDIGFPITTIAAALGTVGLASATGKFVFGWLCDRMLPKYSCSIGLILQLAGILILLRMGPASPLVMIWLYATIIGLGMGSWLPTMSLLTSTNFGLASYGIIYGVMNLGQCIGAAIGPLVAACMQGAMGTYHQAFVIFLALYAIAIPAILVLRQPAGPLSTLASGHLPGPIISASPKHA